MLIVKLNTRNFTQDGKKHPHVAAIINWAKNVDICLVSNNKLTALWMYRVIVLRNSSRTLMDTDENVFFVKIDDGVGTLYT